MVDSAAPRCFCNHCLKSTTSAGPRLDQRILTRYCGTLSNIRLKDITRSAIVEVIHQISKAGSPIMANRVLACIRKAFNFGIRAGICEANPAHFVEAPASERVRDRVYSEQELRRLWRAFEQRKIAGRVFEVCLASGQRLREAAGMRWDEIEGDVWTIQGARTKNKRTHVVPLNELTKSIVELHQGVDDAFVFPSPRRNASAVTNFGKAVLFIREKSEVRDFRAHDLRRTVATELARLGTSQFLIGRILNHVPEGVTARHYDRYEYLEEKRAILQQWAKRLGEIIAAS